MLEIKNQEHLDEVKVFAEKIGKLEQLQSKLDWLDNFGDRESTRVELRSDIGGGLSFVFDVYGRDPRTGFIDKFRFNGGLIFYDKGDSGVGAPQFSVRLDSSECGWEIHT